MVPILATRCVSDHNFSTSRWYSLLVQEVPKLNCVFTIQQKPLLLYLLCSYFHWPLTHTTSISSITSRACKNNIQFIPVLLFCGEMSTLSCKPCNRSVISYVVMPVCNILPNKSPKFQYVLIFYSAVCFSTQMLVCCRSWVGKWRWHWKTCRKRLRVSIWALLSLL